MFAQALARSVRMFRSGPAFYYGDEVVGWDEFGRSIAAVAGALRASGIEQGDRVAVLAGNSPAHVVAMYATWWAGAVLVPLNTRLSVDEMTRIMRESETRCLFSDGQNTAIARELLSAMPLVSIAMDAAAAGDMSWAAACEAEAIDAAATEMSDLGAIYYTGGTTGAPKGVMLSDGALLMQAMSIRAELGIENDSVVQQAPPLFHLAGAGLAQACVLAGAPQIFSTKFDPADLLHSVKHHQATHVSVVPTMLTTLLEMDGVSDAFASVQRIIYGTSSITETLLRKVIDAAPQAGLTQIYGQTECTGPCLFLRPDDHVIDGENQTRLSSAGRPGIHTEVRVVDAEGAPAAPGTAGEIVMRAPSVMMGYWNNTNATQAALRGGWLHTGDVGIEDEAGYIRIVDRIKDMVVTGGENVFCAEVENVIQTHPEVRYCAVIGVPDEKWGEKVHAVVGVAPGSTLTAEALIEHCRAAIAGYKCPKSVEFTSEPLPMSPVGKVRKDLLRAAATSTVSAT